MATKFIMQKVYFITQFLDSKFLQQQVGNIYLDPVQFESNLDNKQLYV